MLFAPASCPRLIVKIGSALLVDEGGAVRRDWLAGIAADIAARCRAGQQVAVVSSGAIALGARRLGLAKGGRASLEDAQAAAATGQIALSQVWAEVLGAEGLTAAQHTRGAAQMLEFGASITKVSKTLAMDKKDVKAQAAVGKAEAARAALDAGQLDLAHAAVVAEFEEAGDTEAVEKLLTTRPYNFDHVAERLRGLREEREAYARAMVSPVFRNQL